MSDAFSRHEPQVIGAVNFRCFYSSSRNTRDFSREIRAQSEIWLHREYNLAMKKWKALARRACRGKNAEAFLKDRETAI